jgi:class 3 adenylate cyclase
MNAPPILDNEPARLREIGALGLTAFDPKDPSLNDIIRIACAVADTPIAMVNILDRPEMMTLRSHGVPDAVPTRMPCESVVCHLVLSHGNVLVIENMSIEARTRNNPIVEPPFSLRFYAGAPLVSANGYIMGTLCTMGTEPKSLDPRAVDALRRLADQATRLLQAGSPRNDHGLAAPASRRAPTGGQFHSQSSIMFTDFVGFTRHTETLEPAELLETLGRYFNAFDKLCRRHNLTRIKTIGDAYMAVAGVPTVNADHARDAVAAALAIRDFVAADNKARVALGDPSWEVRIGVHSGPVISGNLGEQGGLDIWGDTVNVAARLEAASEPGHVNISEATLAQLGNAKVGARGMLPVKNKEPVKMYFVERLN